MYRWSLLVVLMGSWAAMTGGSTQAAEDPSPASPMPEKMEIAAGPFTGEWEAFKQYKCPEWFRDAKLGIWAHWGPQAVPLDGDWYARGMYEPGNGHYKHHLEHYGHPSQHGYKEIIPLWKAENWDPDRLMAVYAQAGAKYFVSMGVHHDNFDLWNSTYHRWNAVKLGPKRDIVGMWQKMAKKYGLRFGVSEHLGASFTWFQAAHRSDKTGPLAGVPYDGADSKYWDLYHQPAAADDKGWYSIDPRWHQEWFCRIKDLVDQYHPDLLYSDGGVPFGLVVDQSQAVATEGHPNLDLPGRKLIAHYYNTSAAQHGGTPEVVYNCKQDSQGGMWIHDLERGVMADILPEPWQTDTSIGDWFYKKGWKYRNTDWVIQMLADIVAKNGNLLINVVQRPDGTLDPEAEVLLGEMASWMAVNSESIFGTRPWQSYGEGAVRAHGGAFGEEFAYTAKDIRYARKGDTLYAIMLGWPADGKVVLRALANGSPAVEAGPTDVTLLGSRGKPTWARTAAGVEISLPKEPPCKHAVVFKLAGLKTVAALDPTQRKTWLRTLFPAPIIGPRADGSLVLDARCAELDGQKLRLQRVHEGMSLARWEDAKDSAEWKIDLPKSGRYVITARVASPHAESYITVEVDGQRIEAKLAGTGNWNKFQTVTLGRLEVKNPGQATLILRPTDAGSWKPVNVLWLRLARVGD